MMFKLPFIAWHNFIHLINNKIIYILFRKTREFWFIEIIPNVKSKFSELRCNLVCNLGCDIFAQMTFGQRIRRMRASEIEIMRDMDEFKFREIDRHEHSIDRSMAPPPVTNDKSWRSELQIVLGEFRFYANESHSRLSHSKPGLEAVYDGI